MKQSNSENTDSNGICRTAKLTLNESCHNKGALSLISYVPASAPLEAPPVHPTVLFLHEESTGRSLIPGKCLLFLTSLYS